MLQEAAISSTQREKDHRLELLLAKELFCCPCLWALLSQSFLLTRVETRKGKKDLGQQKLSQFQGQAVRCENDLNICHPVDHRGLLG